MKGTMVLGILSTSNIAVCLFVLYFSSRKLTDAHKAANHAHEFVKQAQAFANTAQEASGSSQLHSKAAQYHAEDAKEQSRHVRACCTVKKV